MSLNSEGGVVFRFFITPIEGNLAEYVTKDTQ